MRRLINPYFLHPVRIVKINDEAPQVKMFTFELIENEYREEFMREYREKHKEFVEVMVPGVGEAPFSICSSFYDEKLQLCIRAVGNVTRAIHRKKVGDILWIRGPYGRGFPLEEAKKKNVLIVGGGIGLAPLRAVIRSIMSKRGEYGSVTIMYGDRTPEHLLFKKEHKEWRKYFDFLVTVDKADDKWKGCVGVVTVLFKYAKLDPKNTVAMLCGPFIMYRFVIKKLLELGFKENQIYLSLERRMRCGVGNCRHCMIGNRFVCLDGPVFSFDELLKIPRSEVPETWLP